MNIQTACRSICVWIVLVLVLVGGLSAQRSLYAKAAATDAAIYVDALADPWQDWSYNTTVDFDNNLAYAGTKGVAVTHTVADGALSVYNPTPLSGTDYSAISFWAYGAPGGSSITLSLEDNPVVKYPINIPAGVWTHYSVPLNQLGNPANFQRINWQDATAAPQPTYYLDQISVIAAAPATGFPDSTADGSRSLEPGPSGVAVAPNGRVYAAVYKDDRVYSWPSVASMTGGAAPDKTFGAANGDPDGAAGCTNGPAATMMCGPESVAVDSNGNLFVADTYNHRVLVFNNPDTDGTPLAADAVLGQANLTSGTEDYDSAAADGVVEGFCYVRGLAVDSSNRLWVVDEFNHRVVRFDTPTVGSSKPGKVFGQNDLDDHPAGCTFTPSGNSAANRFSLPLGVAVDPAGNVYVADLGNNRVQRFADIAVSGANADASYVGLNQPHDVAVDAKGNLYVANTLNNVILVFAGGAAGDLVSDHNFPGRNFPMGMAFTANGDLLVADCGAPLEGTDYPPCLRGARGVYFFAAPAAPPQLQPPNAVDDTLNTQINTAVNGNVLTNDTDPQGSALTVTSSTSPQGGTVTVKANGDFTFTPNAGFVGQYLFSYTASNAHGLSDTAFVTINVTEAFVPNPPVAVDDSAQTTVNTAVSGNVLINDVDPQGSALTVTGSTQPQSGTVTVAANGSFTFTPAADFVGQATFSYTVSNAHGLSDTATVTIQVSAEEPAAKANLFMPSLFN